MKIALLGYGKMGKEIELVASSRNHTIVSKIDKNFKEGDLNLADIAIDFSSPDAALSNIIMALNINIPVVSGTTGWLKDFNMVESASKKNNVGFLYSSNFSIAVNIFLELNRSLAKLLEKHNEYSIELNETHHDQKIDAPSGTAISIANDIISNSRYEKWSLNVNEKNSLHINSIRKGNIIGIHEVNYKSSGDQIKISHESFSRSNYAIGALIASEWLIGKKGIYSMSDVLNINKK
ncbi:MAG: 4-hydroxy-tetrahydrodipicolinate reductase [Flavobacteriaceae bacterium]|nr:4-hydroxy-tetrahydrodipicolinate reductase [Flavobacteriaceae bacterium]|tara:strand:- start:4919 stop:5626 length:708 start_codon:yes stop_codon:yes gene_type:complete